MEITPKSNTFPELRFVIVCSQRHLPLHQQDEIHRLAKTGLDWHLVYDTAFQQRTLPLLQRTVKKHIPHMIPRFMEKKLNEFSFRNATRNLYVVSFLITLLNRLKKKGIKAVPFKGPVTAQEIYGDIGLRMFSDVDLLIKKKNALSVWRFLVNYGFKPELSLSETQIRKYINVEDNITFFFENKIIVELHWEMSGIYLRSPLLFEDIEHRLGTIHIDQNELINLSAEDLLIYLCIHGAKHRWEFLEQTCLISELVKTRKELNWQLVEKLAADWRCINVLLLGLNLALELFNTSLPERIKKRIRMRQEITELSKAAVNNMFAAQNNVAATFQPKRFSGMHIDIKDTFSDKIHYALRLAFRPTKKDWEQFPVWAPFSFTHYLLRPLRLITEGLTDKNA